MSLINTIRALDDPRFKWRVQGAMLLNAVTLIDDEDPNKQRHARAIVNNPLRDATFAVALVAANPAISSKVTVNEFNTVNTEAVLDDEIQYTVNTNWDALLEEFLGPAPTQL
ncbi:hypothetical protein FDH86_gp036 [Arthrobacter phage Tank]|uniref:Uncharacterized protein n=2 Tax=Tankvirus tank TaxID=1982567 RepID=A0A0U4JV37_9CAUD|nr:hypothetical protein FDH86_gp036 [Arthrobacter phage Tank]ALY10571.1 hypothetical protein TANK_36 [Arthrobacter phage Tank]ALY10897.1 hypothetical protein WILDE_36 [Arthrobacter phage Wilde]